MSDKKQYPEPDIPSLNGMRGTTEWLIDYLHRTSFQTVEPDTGPPILEVNFPDQTWTFFASPYNERSAAPHHTWVYGPSATKYETLPIEDRPQKEGFFGCLSPRAKKVAKTWHKEVIRAFHDRWTNA